VREYLEETRKTFSQQAKAAKREMESVFAELESAKAKSIPETAQSVR
jgi:hypothetical protein